MTDRPTHAPVSEAFRRQAEERAALVEAAMQAARWALPVSTARDAEREVLSRPGALRYDGLPISGDHRPRLGRGER